MTRLKAEETFVILLSKKHNLESKELMKHQLIFGDAKIIIEVQLMFSIILIVRFMTII